MAYKVNVADNGNEDTQQIRENPILRTYQLDKIAISIIGAVLVFMFGQLWTLNSKINSIEIQQAELRGQVMQMVQGISSISDRGSQTAQRTEILVQQLSERMTRFEDFMNKGRRFTADDGDKLEKRVERLEEHLERYPNKSVK